MQRVQTDDRPEQGGDHAPDGAFKNIRIVFFFFFSTRLGGREEGETCVCWTLTSHFIVNYTYLRIIFFDQVFFLVLWHHCMLFTL